jgi:hypothetical protein
MPSLTDFTATLFPVSATLVTVSTPSRRIIVNPLSHIHSLDTIPHQDKTPEDSASCTRGTRHMYQVEVGTWRYSCARALARSIKYHGTPARPAKDVHVVLHTLRTLRPRRSPSVDR